MKVKVVAKDIGISPQKVCLVVDMVRGKKVDEALAILSFVPRPAAKALFKVIKSAAANAENNFQMSPADLKIVDIFANKGHTLKRFRPQSRGRISPILKRSSHITVFVEEEK
ncbi:MAG: 50S ribosomal protein L22 [Chloroflexi bacterium CG_4_9_14_3_um_filter_45_9]|nr:MAG: 50S ribosomal protein L22 [Dehalococcoidia bacterium CG2_30_46_9]PIU23685.1 MAG: 50S ribosomal protein L22 [Chloroflexi bacterium CG08_land_8_20_14_0_20_45_12]PIX27348.1 MAG: 50S ribosomal protein L22 [Chloroflexi bacterium CG_4_8_14_3_um_filter_45_15]PJB50193.1 MAG: 50S ribosomal protein L22 [Chloroflexi bacterium CG_4_9_14_3_um_filter_45_9]